MYDRETVDLALEALALGFTQRQAAELAGASRAAVGEWAAGRLPRSFTGAPARGTIRGEGTGTRAKGGRMGLYDPPASGPLAGLTPDQIENLLLRAVLADLKAAGWDPASISNRSKCELGERLRAATGLPLRSITGFLRISKSSYEYHRSRMAARAEEEAAREAAADEVERVFREEGRCARGYRFVLAELRREAAEAGREGAAPGERAVRAAMRERGLRPVYLRRRAGYSSYAGEIDDAPPNLPLRADGTHDFSADAPNRRWSSDITEFRLPDDPRKVYLSPVLDWYDGRPVGWSVGLSPDAELANSSLRGACATLREGEAPWIHTDRGCHYRWPGWKAICEEHGLTRSMSRKGRSPDNAVTEGFFGRLKNEFFRGRDWRGVTAEEFMGRLDAWMRHYREERLRLFVEDGVRVYDTIDGRRRRLGLEA